MPITLRQSLLLYRFEHDGLHVDRDRAGARFVGELMIAASVIGSGLLISDKLSDINRTLEQLGRTGAEISETLKSVEKHLNSIVKLLEALPDVIKGIVDRAFARDALDRARGVASNLVFYSSEPALFQKSAPNVESECNRLVEYMSANHAKDPTGFATLYFLAPLVATWAQSFSASLRAQEKPFSLLNHPFYVAFFRGFESLLNQYERDESSYEEALHALPTSGRSLRVQAAARYGFVETGEDIRQPGVFAINYYSTSPGVEHPGVYDIELLATGRTHHGPEVISVMPSGYHRFPDPVLAEQAYGLSQGRVAREFVRCRTVKDMFVGRDEMRMTIEAARTSPPSWRPSP